MGERAFLPPLLRSRRAPSGEILARVGVLRPPPTPADRVNLRRFDRWPFEVLAVYVRYIRVLDGPHGARIALIPSRICSPPVRFPPPAHIRVAPRDVLLMQVLSNPPTFRPTVWIGTATDVREGRANGFLDNASPPHTGVLVTIVPDGVSRVVFRFPRHRPRTAAAVVDGNVAIANPIPQFFPETTIWYDASGTVIRRIHAPSPR